LLSTFAKGDEMDKKVFIIGIIALIALFIMLSAIYGTVVIGVLTQ
jgi:hypothetical protein